jgi:hypothetical protein
MNLAQELLFENAAELDLDAKAAWQSLIDAYRELGEAVDRDTRSDGFDVHTYAALNQIAHQPNARALVVQTITALRRRDVCLEQCGLKRACRG